MILTNYYGYRRVNDFSAEGSVFDHRGTLIQSKTDLPIIVINWLNGQMISRETDSLPVEELNKVQAEMAEFRKSLDTAEAPTKVPAEIPYEAPTKAKSKAPAKAQSKIKKKKKAKKKGK